MDIAGELLGNVEKDEDYVYFQMYADPANLEWNTIVRAPDTGLSLDGDDYVHITGTVVGSMEGENAFGGTVSAVQVEADSVEEIEAVEAVDPAQETAELDKTMTDQGFSITLQKIEFAENSTRLYVKLRNDTGAVANFYAFDSTIVQGSTQIDQETPFDYEVKEPQDTLSPGVESEGVLVFGPVDYSQPFNVTFEWSSDNYNITPRPIRLQLNP